MGMDQCLWARKGSDERINLADWRKHYELDYFIGEHYDDKLSVLVDDPDSWNGALIRIDLEDVESIIKAYTSGELEDGCGDREDKETDLDVFLHAKELIEQGYTIWYSACY